MPSNAPSVDVLGLVLVTSKVEADPRSDFYGHGPTHVVERIAKWLDEADEHRTLGQLVARYGLDEGDQIAVRFATAQEQAQRLAALASPVTLKRDGSTRCPSCGGFTIHFEDCPQDPEPPDPSLHVWGRTPRANRCQSCYALVAGPILRCQDCAEAGRGDTEDVPAVGACDPEFR